MSFGSALVPTESKRSLRRISTNEASHEALNFRRPTVVVPPKHLVKLTDAHETAATFELARQTLEEYSDPFSPPETPEETTVTDRYAFAFDIDGVLIRGGKPIPEAIEAMKVLNGENQFGIKMSVSTCDYLFDCID